MKLKFKNQSYQDDAVRSVVNIFEGQAKGNRKSNLYRHKVGEGLFEHIEDVISFGNNKISLSDSELKDNIRKVQKTNDLPYTNDQGYLNFSIEMETGTGKTFTYIKTMYELNNNYGWSKFIVMVPSIAIREGVQKSFEITQDYFQEVYHKKIRFFVYNSNNSSNIANINSFASDDSIQVMIINYQAFNGKGAANRRIYEELDELQSNRPIDVIKSVNPILIVDEPQKFGDKTEELFTEFKPLFILRYSATHKKNKEYNKIYRLDAVDAYNEKLVKKINVKGIEILNDKSEGAYLFLDRVDISKSHDPEALLEIDVKSSTGTKRKLIRIKAGDDLYYKSGELTEYKGYVVSEIDGRLDTYDNVIFTNGIVIRSGEVFGNADEKDIIRVQIRETIISHLEKERELFKLGIKTLSLFFIDEVKKYRDYDQEDTKGEYAHIFEEEYLNVVNDYRTIFEDDYVKYLDSFNSNQVHAGYFSIDKKGHSVDPTIKDKKEYTSDDESAYDLIMKDKERLLSFEEPVRFIFSHSALREGWDNPNIFQICTLKHSNSEISKRQEIGRGLRICVDNEGNRMDLSVLDDNFFKINTLTVIASESYDSFAKGLQDEMSKALASRPRQLTIDFLKEKKELVNSEGNVLEFNDSNILNLMMFMKSNAYVDDKGNITDNFKDKVEAGELNLEEFEEFHDEIVNMMKKIYDINHTEFVHDERRNNIRTLSPNDNFNKKEFQELWNKINIKTVYEVDFDSNELIEKAVSAIDSKLRVNKMKTRITEGEQKDEITATQVQAGTSMTNGSIKVKTMDNFVDSTVKYDLIGEVVKDTNLTRKTVCEILSRITPEKFDYYRYNPEEFIRKVCNFINEEKATTVIDGITYHKTDNKYSNDIFTINNINGELGENAIDVKKHIYDYLITDSHNELEFARKLESGEVTVYAKLPSGFKIPTPVGNYNPDWAIVFDNKDFKYVYFIAETKGSMSTMQLRETEHAKIECAKKHFAALSNSDVKYDVVNSYDELVEMMTV